MIIGSKSVKLKNIVGRKNLGILIIRVLCYYFQSQSPDRGTPMHCANKIRCKVSQKSIGKMVRKVQYYSCACS